MIWNLPPNTGESSAAADGQQTTVSSFWVAVHSSVHAGMMHSIADSKDNSVKSRLKSAVLSLFIDLPLEEVGKWMETAGVKI